MIRIGKSTALVPEHAAEEVVSQALRQCKNPNFGFVFSTDSIQSSKLAEALTTHLGSIPWAGCTSAGIFAGNRYLSSGVVLGILDVKDVKIGVGVASVEKMSSREAGKVAMLEALKDFPKTTNPSTKSIIVLADMNASSITEIIRGAIQHSGTLNAWSGGGVGNMISSDNTSEFAHGRAWQKSVVIIAIDSQVPIQTGISHGWNALSSPVLVTRAEGNKIYELEYQEALKVYSELISGKGKKISEKEFKGLSVMHPLGIPQTNGEYVIRDLLQYEPDSSLHCIGEVPTGCLIRVMQGTSSGLLKAAKESAMKAKQTLNKSPGGAFIFDCISRFSMLGGNYTQELQMFQEGLGNSVPFLGCLTVGEIGSSSKQIPLFHNKTAVVMAVPRSTRPKIR